MLKNFPIPCELLLAAQGLPFGEFGLLGGSAEGMARVVASIICLRWPGPANDAICLSGFLP
jgi:hypothetical protein